MDRDSYTACMVPFMKGGGPDRKLRFCIGAKVCSQKAATEAEAEQICINQPPKEPKSRVSRSGKCITEAPKLAACLSTNLDMDGLTIDNLEVRLEAALIHCQAKKSGKSGSPTFDKFMRNCIKENGRGGDLKSSMGSIKKCQNQWRRQTVTDGLR